MKYLISYDLVGPDQDYPTLWDELENLGANRILDSQWAVRLRDYKAKEAREGAVYLFNRLSSVLDDDDILLVTLLTPATVSRNLLSDMP